MRINLLKKRRSITEQQYLRERKIFMWSVVGFIVVVLSGVVLFSMQLVAMRKLKKVNNEVKTLEARKKKLEKIAVEHLYVKKRINLISDLMNSRLNNRKALENILSFKMDGVHLSSAVASTGNVLSISVDADDVNSLDNVYDYFKNDDFFVYVVNNGVSKNKDGYSMRLSLGLPTLGGVGNAEK